MLTTGFVLFSQLQLVNIHYEKIYLLPVMTNFFNTTLYIHLFHRRHE